MLLAGFTAGVTSYKFFLDSLGTNQQSSAACKAEVWQEAARKAAWIQSSECPAYPLELKVTSPGSGSVVTGDPRYPNWLLTPVVVAGTRPLPKNSHIGLIFKPADSANYYVIFPGFLPTNSENIFRRDLRMEMPFLLKPGLNIEVRALIVDDDRKIGNQFTSIEQIKGADSSVFVSDLIVLNIK